MCENEATLPHVIAVRRVRGKEAQKAQLFGTNGHTVVISDFHALRKPRRVILIQVKKPIFE
jgi:hypothetical protein